MSDAFGSVGGDRPPKPSDVAGQQVPRVEVVEYDADKGVVRHITESITSEIEVRQGVVDKATRIAVIAELEKLGYTVTEPGRPLTRDEYQMLDLIRGLVRVYNCWTVAEGNELDIDSLLRRAREIIEEAHQ